MLRIKSKKASFKKSKSSSSFRGALVASGGMFFFGYILGGTYGGEMSIYFTDVFYCNFVFKSLC